MTSTVVAALALLLVPGALLGWASGMRPLLAVAASGPLVLGVCGFTAWLAGALGIPFGLPIVAAMWALFTAVGYLVRFFIRSAAGEPDQLSPGYLTAALTAAVSLVGATRILLALHDVPGGPGSIREAWDMLWHTNFLRFIEESGQASPDAAGLLANQETQSASFYPSGWHAMASLLPGDVFMQANVFSFLAPIVILAAGVAVLARTVAGPRWSAVAGPVAAVLSLLAPEIWIALWKTSSMPYLLSVAALPIAVALVMRGHVVGAALAIVGMLSAHPASAVTFAIFVGLWFITQPSWSGLARTVAIALASAAMSAPMLLSASSQGDAVAGFTGQIDVTRQESLWRTLVGMSSHTEHIIFNRAWVALFAVGLIVALLRRRPWTPWPTLAFIVLAVVSDSAQVRWVEPFGSAFKLLGTFYYDMPYRIQAPMGILRILGATLAITAAVSLVNSIASRIRRNPDDSLHDDDEREPSASEDKREPKPLAKATAMVTALACAAALVPVSWATAADEKEVVQSGFGDYLINDRDKEALEWLRHQPHAFEGHILNDRKDGSAWMYAEYGLPSLYRHFSFEDRSAKETEAISMNVDMIGTDQKQFSAMARDLGIRYVFSSPPTVPRDGTEGLSMRSWAWWSPGLTPVYQDGATLIFAVKEMFTASELSGIVRNSPHRPGARDPLLAAARQPIIPPADETSDPLAGQVIDVSAGKKQVAAINKVLDDAASLAPSPQAGMAQLEKRIREILVARGAIVAEGTDGGDEQGNDGVGSEIGDWGGAGYTGSSPAATVVLGTSAPAGGDSPAAGSDAPWKGFTATTVGTSRAELRATRASWQLSAGIRDSLVFRGFTPHSGFDDKGLPKEAFTGLAVSTSPNAPQTPTTAVSLGSYGNAELADDLKDPNKRELIAIAIVDGIASMLRQSPGATAADNATGALSF
nr:DUF6541 family protein [Corynebacterium lactis]